MNAQDIVDTIATKLGLDPGTAEKAAGIILSVLEHEASDTTSAAIFSKIPGAADLAHGHDVMAGATADSGLLGSLGSALGGVLGEKTGAMINGIAQLRSLGLDMSQIQQAGTTLIQQAEVAAGPKAVSGLVAEVPALKEHFGL